jgi:hypothetical protein
MQRIIQTISLITLSVIWLAIVIPGTTSEHGINWESLLFLGLIPVASLWFVFLLLVWLKRDS